MNLESRVYDSPREHSRPSTPATQHPTTAPTRNTSSASSSSGFVRRLRSAVVPPVTASFAPTLDHPVSPTSSSTSSLFSSAPTQSSSSVSATYQSPPSWITSDPYRNVLAPPPFLQGHTVAVGEAAFSNAPSGGYFGAVVVDSSSNGSGSGNGSGNGSGDQRIGFEKIHDTPDGSVTHLKYTGGIEPPSRSTSSVNSAFSSRRHSRDGQPPKPSDLAPFPTVFSLSNPSSPTSRARLSLSPPPTHISQDSSNPRRPPYNRSAGSSEYRATPRSYIVKPSDFDSHSDHYNNSYLDNNHNQGVYCSPSAMIGNIHGEPDNEYVKRQFLPRGSVISEASASASTVQFPLPDSDFVELLNQDDRPTFIVDIANAATHGSGPLSVLFANPALKERPLVLDQITNTNSEKTEHDYALFKNWALGLSKQNVENSTPTEPVQDEQTTPTAATSSSVLGQHMAPSPPIFAGWHWAASTIRRHYRVIRGIGEDGNSSSRSVESDVCSTSVLETAKPLAAPESSGSIASLTKEAGYAPESAVLPRGIGITLDDENLSFDWTRIAMTDNMPPHIKFARSVDWASTPLGPIESWPGDLRLMSNLVMASPYPTAMYWGPSYTAIYNEAYTELAGQKHPRLMGSNYPSSWAEIWNTIEPFFESAWNTGQSFLKQDNRIFMKRNGFLEETFCDWSLVPLVGSDGSVVGLYNPAFENTRPKVNERRMILLNEIGERTAKASTIHEFWDAVGCGLESNEYDVPFALLYSVVGNNGSEDEESDNTSTPSSNDHSSPQVILEGSIGVSGGHQAAFSHLDLSTSEEGFAPYMRRAITEYQEASVLSASPPPIVLSREDGTLPADLMVGLESERGFGDPCRTVVVIPVLNPSTSSTGAGTIADLDIDSNAIRDVSSHKSLYGFLVMGTNPRRPYNGDYRLFVHLLARQLTTSLASVVLFREEVRRNQRETRRAAQDHHELSEQLLLRTREAMESENKFMRMAEFTPVGMFVTDNTGKISYCNDMWWEISRHPKVEFNNSPNSDTVASVPMVTPTSNSPWATWMDSVQADDQPGLMVVWDRLVRDKMAITHEFRFKQSTTIHIDGNDPLETTTWVLLRAYPEKDEHGNLKGIFGCITDISQQKLAEEFQIQLRKEAVEHKRQQENFIDITSHEMRNPLSAILQTVDEITSSISELRERIRNGQEPDYTNAFDTILEASHTISICSNHQKRIVDDVLTLSKLDSRLLPVTPVDVQPVMVIRSTIKMVESELIAHDIHCTFRVQPSYENLVGLSSWVKLDPSRLNQILINLLTNAIKFTRSSGKRSITVSLGASEGGGDPTKCDVVDSIAELSYVPSRQDKPELADGPDWGDGQLVNLHVAVSDTGQGLLEDEKNELFWHFTQSFPRTHVQYGGFGLGLYICRNLAELQGGQISVTSEKDQGSTFAFYVKCRKVPSTPTGIEPGSSSLSSIVTTPGPGTNPSSFIAYISDGSRNGAGSCHCQSKSKSFEIPTVLPQLPSSPVLIDTPIATPCEVPSQPILSLDAAISAPTVTVTSAPAADGQPNSNEVDDNKVPAADEAMPSFDVLIVEDNLVNQRVLQRQLDKGGNRTIVANHGGEALDILRQSTFWREHNSRSSSIAEIGTSPRLHALGIDTAMSLGQDEAPARTNISIVLMDLEMPVMGGMTCARAIRALERSGTLLRHVPIIAVTAYARQEQIDSAKAAGIDDVISKPFRITQLMPKIQELVAKYNTNPGP